MDYYGQANSRPALVNKVHPECGSHGIVSLFVFIG